MKSVCLEEERRLNKEFIPYQIYNYFTIFPNYSLSSLLEVYAPRTRDVAVYFDHILIFRQCNVVFVFTLGKNI